jgi:hypothetical protein
MKIPDIETIVESTTLRIACLFVVVVVAFGLGAALGIVLDKLGMLS